MRLRLVLPLWLALVAGCAPRGAITIAPEAAATGSVQSILVATSREPGAGLFTRGRSERLGFGRFDVAVPPERAPGTVSYPRGGRPDPATDFVTVSAARFRDADAFVAAVNAGIAGRPARNREAIVFVHGFNTNFAEGVYRHAQMVHDFRLPAVSVHYAWPSAGSVWSYAFDRESALFARDGLEELLDALTRSNLSRIVLVGHSMGALVVMDTVRQMAIRGSPALFAKLQAVVLIAPDLDVEVFRTQLRPIEAGRDVSVYVFVSGGDRALRFSSLLRGEGERLGSIRDVSRVADFPITVIDISDVEATEDALGHFKVATSPAMIALISGMDEAGLEMFRDEPRQPDIFETSVNVFQNVTEVVLRPPAQ
jgi:esterase/lipase superfamily enzyme